MTNQDKASSLRNIASTETDMKDKEDDSFLEPGAESIRRGGARNEIVRLDVGGTKYKVSRNTLMRFEGSMLASLVSGKWKEGDGEGEIFIDRDGRRFGYILDYLRSDRVYVTDLVDQSALKDEFEYFGIDADMSKVSVMDDYVSIDELTKEIKEHEAAIEQKKKKRAAIKESYNVAGTFASAVEKFGPYIVLSVNKDVDQALLRDCLLSRGLHVVSYENTNPGAPRANICLIGRKDQHV